MDCPLGRPEAGSRAGAEENYTCTEKDGITTMAVTMEPNDDDPMARYFNATWPKALQKECLPAPDNIFCYPPDKLFCRAGI